MLLKHLKLPHQTLLPPISKVMGCLLTPSGMKGAHGLMYRRLQCDFCFLTVSTCVLWCLARSLELLKAFWQPGCWQRYGFSPVWLLKWILRFSSLEKAFLHPSNYKRERKNMLSKLQQQTLSNRLKGLSETSSLLWLDAPPQLRKLGFSVWILLQGLNHLDHKNVFILPAHDWMRKPHPNPILHMEHWDPKSLVSSKRHASQSIWGTQP